MHILENFKQFRIASTVNVDDILLKNLTQLLEARKELAHKMLVFKGDHEAYKCLSDDYDHADLLIKQLLGLR